MVYISALKKSPFKIAPGTVLKRWTELYTDMHNDGNGSCMREDERDESGGGCYVVIVRYR